MQHNRQGSMSGKQQQDLLLTLGSSMIPHAYCLLVTAASHSRGWPCRHESMSRQHSIKMQHNRQGSMSGKQQQDLLLTLGSSMIPHAYCLLVTAASHRRGGQASGVQGRPSERSTISYCRNTEYTSGTNSRAKLT